MVFFLLFLLVLLLLLLKLRLLLELRLRLIGHSVKLQSGLREHSGRCRGRKAELRQRLLHRKLKDCEAEMRCKQCFVARTSCCCCC
mgnify:CR=1 FL=1